MPARGKVPLSLSPFLWVLGLSLGAGSRRCPGLAIFITVRLGDTPGLYFLLFLWTTPPFFRILNYIVCKAAEKRRKPPAREICRIYGMPES